MGQILAIKTQEATKQKDLALKAAGNRDGPPLYWLRIIAILHPPGARAQGRGVSVLDWARLRP